jgi:hypothetical protein
MPLLEQVQGAMMQALDMGSDETGPPQAGKPGPVLPRARPT